MDTKELTVEEKAALVSGTDFMYTNSLPRAGVPQIRMSDGPHGLRVQTEGGDNGIMGSEPATAFPTASALASGWNEENAYRMGRAIAEECRYYGVDVLLGPAMNIKRNPLGGRSFEYFSEDPYLAGRFAAAQVKGLQEGGASACLKHFALNNAENFRFMGNSVCDERAMREIYLKPFEIAVKESHPHAVMCAYNQINGTYCSENGWLLNELLRGEWGFDGVVMTDWGASHDRIKMLRAGCDLEMPGDTAFCRRQILDGIQSGELGQEDLDKAAENVLKLAQRAEGRERAQADFEAHSRLAEEIAADCAVLLKNDGALPLDKREGVCIVGELFEQFRYQGAGSSMITPYELTSPKAAFDEKMIAYAYAKGYHVNAFEPDEQLITAAVECAHHFKKIIVFAGLTDYAESEGADREDMRLPEGQLALIEELVRTGKQIIVVLFGGAPVELPFEGGVSAILNMYLSGQSGGRAALDLLFGDKTPCGKLAETWAERYEDIPFGENFSKSRTEVYKESVFVGYRYFQSAKRRVRYPFGYGLSYTAFAYSDLSVSEEGNQITVSCTVTNVGWWNGAEVVQLYVKAPRTDVFKPEKELRAFCKLYLKAGESGRAELRFCKDDLRYWNINEHRFCLEGGEYELQVCSDCESVRLCANIFVSGESVPSPYSADVQAVYGNADTEQVTDELFEQMSGLKIPAIAPLKPINLDSRFTDLQETFFGKILCGVVLGVVKRKMKRARRLPEGTERENGIKGALFLRRVLESASLISMTMTAGKRFPYNFAQGVVSLANGKVFQGISCFCKKIKVPKLPKDKKRKG